MSQFEIVLAVMVVVLSLKSLADKIRTAQKESDYEDAKKKVDFCVGRSLDLCQQPYRCVYFR